MKFQPLRDEVLVEFVPIMERLTPAGLVLPDSVEVDRAQRETIVRAVGPGRMLADGSVVTMSVNPGDYVLLGTDVGKFHDPDDGRVYTFVSELGIVAIVTEPQKALSPTAKLVVPAPTPVVIGKNGKPIIVRQ